MDAFDIALQSVIMGSFVFPQLKKLFCIISFINNLGQSLNNGWHILGFDNY